MTMHLEGPWLTSTSTRRRVTKMTKARRERLELGLVEHNKFLKSIHQSKMTFDQYVNYVEGRHKRQVSMPIKKVEPYRRETKHIPSLNSQVSSDACGKKNVTMYTGDKLLGIAIMHKSNLVPIFSTEEASDVARMRRG